MPSKIYKVIVQERDKYRAIHKAEYNPNINYNWIYEKFTYYADAKHHIELNRSFINLGLTNHLK